MNALTGKNMKRIFVMLLSAAMILCGCSDNSEMSDTETKAETGQTSADITDNTSAEPIGTDSNETEQITESDAEEMLVVYFSRTNNTEKIAQMITEYTCADSYEIEAAVPYTDEDIEYNNSSCRANKEQNDKSVRPEISEPIGSIDQYDFILLGYPIWWGEEPRIIDTFLESYDFSDKTVIPFCTSASSGIGTSESNIAQLIPIRDQPEGRRFSADASEDEVKEWVDSLNISDIT